MKKERGIHELYSDPERADTHLWGRKPDPLTRRGFLNRAGLTAMALAVGSHIPFARNMPGGLIPAAFAQDRPFVIDGKEDLVVLNQRPLGAEARAHQLDDEVTPTRYHYVRNNGNLGPMARSMDSTGYKLIVDGEVDNPLELSLEDLKRDFPTHTWNLQLECTGNGRAGYDPHPSGMQWTIGAVACSRWTGVSMADVLKAAGVRPTAVYTANHSDDIHLSGNPEFQALSRGVPISKAMNPYNMLAWEMNGERIPNIHGFPVRIVIPGWAGSASAKWIKRIQIRNQVHDGRGMTGMSYRVNKYPVRAGTDVAVEDMEIVQSMPVKSLITRPEAGITAPVGSALPVRGQAWAGDATVRRVDISLDFGQTWQTTRLSDPANPYAWQRWKTAVRFPVRGYYEIWARATDSDGKAQPPVVPGWNPRGYLNNVTHRIAVTAV